MGLVVAGVAVLIAVVSGGGEDGPQLSELARQGKDLAVKRSCVGCHGRSGEGGANHSGPPWVGLYLSTVSLADGSSVVADEAYLTESILQPKLKQTAGWGQMPEANLNAADLRAIIAYIEELTPARAGS
jgi:cytochrome c oxidase subunit 2